MLGLDFQPQFAFPLGPPAKCWRVAASSATDRTCCLEMAACCLSAAWTAWWPTLQHAAAATALSLHPTDDARLYSGSKDGLVTLWDLPTGTEVQRWRVESPVESLVVAEDAGGRQQHMHSPLHAARLLLCGLLQGGETHTMYVGIAACPPV